MKYVFQLDTKSSTDLPDSQDEKENPARNIPFIVW